MATGVAPCGGDDVPPSLFSCAGSQRCCDGRRRASSSFCFVPCLYCSFLLDSRAGMKQAPGSASSCDDAKCLAAYGPCSCAARRGPCGADRPRRVAFLRERAAWPLAPLSGASCRNAESASRSFCGDSLPSFFPFPALCRILNVRINDGEGHGSRLLYCPVAVRTPQGDHDTVRHPRPSCSPSTR